MQTIVIERRQENVVAYLKDKKAFSGYGQSTEEAVGKLIRHHRQLFEIAIEWDVQSFKEYGHFPLTR